MIVLGVDTCGQQGSLALATLGQTDPPVELERLTLPGRRFAGELVPSLRGLLGRHALAPAQLGALVVVHGPGSFTGIRIGVSAVKALSEAAGLPVVAISRLQVLAGAHGAEYAALDAGRGEVYLAAGAEEWLLTREQAAEKLGGREDRRGGPVTRIVVCEPALASAWPGTLLVEEPGGFEAVLCARPRLLAAAFDDVAALDGNYVRALAYAQSR